MTPDTPISPVPGNEDAYREALGCFATGVTVITTMTDTGPVAMTANSFASVSLDPPLVLWCAARKSARHDLFTRAPSYAIHVMDQDQLPLAAHFARTGHDFESINWHLGQDGQPVLEGCLARFDCALQQVHDAGDHSIILGRVTQFAYRSGSGLIFKRGLYGGFADLL